MVVMVAVMVDEEEGASTIETLVKPTAAKRETTVVKPEVGKPEATETTLFEVAEAAIVKLETTTLVKSKPASTIETTAAPVCRLCGCSIVC